MRFLKIVLTALMAAFAIFAGLFIAVVATITSVVLFFFRHSPTRPHLGRTVPLSQSGEARPTKMRDLDVIDVSATEVPADPADR